jgi:hypothetical protein
MVKAAEDFSLKEDELLLNESYLKDLKIGCSPNL